MLDFLSLSEGQLLPYIKTVGYPALLFIMIIEGPIATIIGAFLASIGVFNVFIILFLSILGDIIGDIICYAIGFYGGSKALKKAEKVLKVKPRIIERLEKLFSKHGRKTIFAVKSTTGLCWITFIAAGALKMDFKKFLQGSIGGGIIWSGFLVIAGYFFGYAFERIEEYIKYAGIIILALAIIFYISIGLYKKKQSEKVLAEKQS